MNLHEFYVIKVFDGKKEKFFTGGYKRRRFSRLCKWFGIDTVVPDLTSNMREAEFHLSPQETQKNLVTLRAKFPKVRWFFGSAILPDYTNEAMMPRFCIVIRDKANGEMGYYVSKNSSCRRLNTTNDINKATWLNIDEVSEVCEDIRINYKYCSYQAMEAPKTDVPLDKLMEYLEQNPPRSFYMTFSLKKK